MNEARAIRLGFTECTFRHMGRRKRGRQGDRLMFSRRYVCFQPGRLEDVNVRSPTSGRKMFPRALAKRNGVVLLQQDEEGGFRHVDCSDGEGCISKTAISRRHQSRVQMKAIYSIKQLRHSSNVGGATQHNGWHRSTAILPTRWKSRTHPGYQGHAAGNRRSGGDKRPFRRQGHHADCRKCRSARRSTCSGESEAKRPARMFDELNASNS